MALAADSVLTAANMKMPVIGLGTWQGGEELEKVLDTALEAGYRHIDTAYVYQNEQHIGVVIKKWLDSGKLKREDLFIVTKLCPTHLRPDDIEKSINESLKKLQLSYVDLFLIHNPVGLQFSDNLFPIGPNGELLLDMSTDLVACWKAMENLVDAGLTKSIGLSNFNIGQIQRILDSCRIKPANLQVELYVYMQQPELVQFCKANGITICAYGPIGSPSLKKFTESNNLPTENLNILSPMTDPIVTDLAKKYGKAPAQILLRFLLQLGVAVIPKSSNPERLRSNIDIFDFDLTEEDFAKLKSLDRGEKGRQFGNSGIFAPMMPHPEYPFPK